MGHIGLVGLVLENIATYSWNLERCEKLVIRVKVN